MKLFRILRTIRTALKALRRNPMRAALTALGIIIGVAAVIIMMEIGKGSSSAIQRTIASMGANNLLVHPGAAASGGVSFGGGSGMNLTPQDCDAIIRECPAVGSVTLEVQARAQLTYGNRNWVPLAINGQLPPILMSATGITWPRARCSRTVMSATAARCAYSGRRWCGSFFKVRRLSAEKCG